MTRPMVIVTGSSGLIGHPLCRRLAARYRVIGFDRAGPPVPPSEVEAIDVDLTSDSDVSKAFSQLRARHGNRLSSIVHLAAYYDFTGANSSKYQDITVNGTRRLLQAARDFETEQFIFSSTMLVHAPCALGQHLNEEWPVAPAWPYPRSKVETELLLRRERGPIPVVALRIAGVYTEAGDSLPISQQMQRIYEKQLTSHLFPGNPRHGQALVHVEDVLGAIEATIDRRSALPPETILLIGEADPVSYGTLQKTFGRILHGKDWWTLRIPKWFAKIGAALLRLLPSGRSAFIRPWMIDRADDHYALDLSRAERLIGWVPKRSIRDALPKMANALLRDPLGWYRRHDLKPPKRLLRRRGIASGTPGNRPGLGADTPPKEVMLPAQPIRRTSR